MDPRDDDGLGELRRSEKRLWEARREFLGMDKAAPLVGLALSGGGIRSATFCLGFLQALSRYRLLPGIDQVSTVSGGSYTGSFLGALFVPPSERGYELSATPPKHDFDPGDPLGSARGVEATRRLRESGRYLTPGGTSDAILGGAIVLRNWAAVQAAIGAVALLLFCALRAGEQGMELGDAALLVTLLAAAAGVALACAAGYWLTRRDWIPASRLGRIALNLFFWAFAGAAAYASSPYWVPALTSEALPWWLPAPGIASAAVAAVLVTAIAAYLVAELLHGSIQARSVRAHMGKADAREERARAFRNQQLRLAAEDRVRAALSGWMATAMTAALVLAGILAVDLLGRMIAQAGPGLYNNLTSGSPDISRLWEASPFITTVVAPVLTFVANQLLKRRSEGNRVGAPSWLERRAPSLITIAAFLVLGSWLALWSAVSHLLLGGTAAGRPVIDSTEGALLLIGLLVAANLVVSVCYSFINLSSLSTFYATRLRRAYIGASSSERTVGDIGDDQPQDTISIDSYYHAIHHGAPLHLINVTIAETVTGSSNLVARDRKGKPMHLSPVGIVHEGERPGHSVVHELEWGEQLPLASWVAISGAAVSSAIGSGTSLGTSILATMANVRLGYWWKRSAARDAGLLWRSWRDNVQNYLLLELRGAFSGTRGDRWYLTDGGHFENTGIYALLQRRAGFIIACDNGADPNYGMGDLVRLIGRARTDLGAEVTFLGTREIERRLGKDSPLQGLIGSFQEIASRGAAERPGGPIAALATITYQNGAEGLLLLVKPRLTFNEPPDLLAYHARPGSADFPQQTTADQFFDEEQWEAYRQLGDIAGRTLFQGAATTGWSPRAALVQPAPVLQPQLKGAAHENEG